MKYNRPHATAAWGQMAKNWEQGIDYRRLSLERLERARRWRRPMADAILRSARSFKAKAIVRQGCAAPRSAGEAP